MKVCHWSLSILRGNSVNVTARTIHSDNVVVFKNPWSALDPVCSKISMSTF